MSAIAPCESQNRAEDSCSYGPPSLALIILPAKMARY
jgi:hypothetical protein